MAKIQLSYWPDGNKLYCKRGLPRRVDLIWENFPEKLNLKSNSRSGKKENFFSFTRNFN